MRALAGLLMTALLMPTAACGEKEQAAAKPAPITVRGTATSPADIAAFAFAEEGKPCDPTGTEVQPGTPVSVKNSSGKQVAVGSLESGVGDDAGGCQMAFKIVDVPRDSTYTLSIAGQDDYPFEAANAGDIALTLN